MAGKNAQDGFNRFVEGDRRDAPLDESKKDFWDSFSNIADDPQEQQKPQPRVNSSVGTNAMKTKPASSSSSAPAAKKNDEWDDW